MRTSLADGSMACAHPLPSSRPSVACCACWLMAQHNQARAAAHSPHLPNLACSAQVKSTPGAMSVQLEERSAGREGGRGCSVQLEGGCERRPGVMGAAHPGLPRQPLGRAPSTSKRATSLRWSVSGTRRSWRARAGTHPPSGRPDGWRGGVMAVGVVSDGSGSTATPSFLLGACQRSERYGTQGASSSGA